jgi:YjbE family integral membrane protein
VEYLSLEFASALAAIVVIDLALAGDNAIVIALAARNVPRHLQRRAIVAGAAGALAVRLAMTLLVVWLLRIPGLLMVGGLLLVYIAFRLLRPEAGGAHAATTPASDNFWVAMRTIIVADAVMGLDNVLAVAGAAHGSFVLVVLGLLISVPILIWGSTFVLRIVERHPSVVYLGAGVLVSTAVSMITHEPLLKDAFDAAHRATVPAFYAVAIFGVLWAAFVGNHRRLESRIHARVKQYGDRAAADPAAPGLARGESAMMKILVPIDGSASSIHAARHVVKTYAQNPAQEIHLLAVQRRFSRHISQFLNRKDLEAFYREEGEKKLRAVRAMFDGRDIPYVAHVEIGRKAETIVAMAKRLSCDRIVMGTARKNSLTRMIEASVTNEVLELTPVPVEVIAGDAISNLERYGIPAGIGAGLALLLAAED